MALNFGGFTIPFVLGFPVIDNQVLMLYRHKEPWKNRWNGAGGKIEPEETALAALHREMEEETGLDLSSIAQTTFTGLVTWELEELPPNTPIPGMATFISRISSSDHLWDKPKAVPEGQLAWHSLEWVNNRENSQVADNIPHFLPPMLSTGEPLRYHCLFRNQTLYEVVPLPLPAEILRFI